MRSAVRVYGGWLVALVGAILCAIGWYGVSGEKYEARQMPYLASATVPGAALIVAGAVLVAARTRGGGGDGGDEALRRQVAELHALILEPADLSAGSAAGSTTGWVAGSVAAAEPRSGGGGSAREGDGASDASGAASGTPGAEVFGDMGAPWVSLPAGARYHRPGCELVRGKPGVFGLDATRAAELDLRACALCDPDGEQEARTAEAGGSGGSGIADRPAD